MKLPAKWQCSRCAFVVEGYFTPGGWSSTAMGWICPNCCKTCAECGAEMIRTSESWLVCPHGHGKLIPAPDCRPAVAQREERQFLKNVDRVMRDFRKHGENT